MYITRVIRAKIYDSRSSLPPSPDPSPQKHAYLLIPVVPAALMETQAEQRRQVRLSGHLGVLAEDMAGRGTRHEDEVQRAAFADPPRPLSLSGRACVRDFTGRDGT